MSASVLRRRLGAESSHCLTGHRWLSTSTDVPPPASQSSSSTANDGGSEPVGKLADLVQGALSPRSTVGNKKSGRRKIPLGPSVLENSKLRQHLEHIESTKDDLVIEDVERHKPEKILDPRLTTYDAKYSSIRAALMQSFTLQQLRTFLKLYNLKLPQNRDRTKDLFAEIILKKWGWEPLEKVHETRTEWKEMAERQYPMGPGAAFLFVGKDGMNLLHVAKQYNVHLSFTSNPLTLRADGLKGAMKQLDEYMKTFLDDIGLERLELPLDLQLSPEICQSISRLSGVYVESSDANKLFVTYRKSKPEFVEVLKRLAVQASSEELDDSNGKSVHMPKTILTTQLPTSDTHSFSFYPFFSSQTATRALQSASPFRLRRVGRWLRTGPQYDSDGYEIIDAVSIARPTDIDIKDYLLSQISGVQLQNSRTVVTASAGHFLFLSPGQSTFNPPIPGNVDLDSVIQWAKGNTKQLVFKPSVPKSLMLQVPYKQQQLQRLVYRSYEPDNKEEQGILRKSFILEMYNAVAPLPEQADSADQANSSVVCKRTVEASMDVLLPSRTTDIQVSAAHVEEMLFDNIPEVLKTFIAESKLNPSLSAERIPLTLSINGVPFILSSNSQVQRNHRKLASPPRPRQQLLHSSRPYDFVVESIISEDGQDMTVCKLTSDNPETDSDWEAFLLQCDTLTLADNNPAAEHPLNIVKPWFKNHQQRVPLPSNEVQ